MLDCCGLMWCRQVACDPMLNQEHLRKKVCKCCMKFWKSSTECKHKTCFVYLCIRMRATKGRAESWLTEVSATLKDSQLCMLYAHVCLPFAKKCKFGGNRCPVRPYPSQCPDVPWKGRMLSVVERLFRQVSKLCMSAGARSLGCAAFLQT